MKRERRQVLHVRARRLMYEEGHRWPDALAAADIRCGARNKKDGKPCQARALPNGRCRWHGGIVAPWTPERREAQRQRAKAQARSNNRWAKAADKQTLSPEDAQLS